MNWLPPLKSVGHDGIFYNKEWNSLLKAFMKCCCVLIAQVKESDVKRRNERSQHQTLPFSKNACCWLDMKNTQYFWWTAENTLKFNIVCI